jgi:hypothetical protein
MRTLQSRMTTILPAQNCRTLEASDEAAGVAEAVLVEGVLQRAHQRERRRRRAPGVDQRARFGGDRVEDDVAAALRRHGDRVAQSGDVPVGAHAGAAGERRVAQRVVRDADRRIRDGDGER